MEGPKKIIPIEKGREIKSSKELKVVQDRVKVAESLMYRVLNELTWREKLLQEEESKGVDANFDLIGSLQLEISKLNKNEDELDQCINKGQEIITNLREQELNAIEISTISEEIIKLKQEIEKEYNKKE